MLLLLLFLLFSLLRWKIKSFAWLACVCTHTWRVGKQYIVWKIKVHTRTTYGICTYRGTIMSRRGRESCKNGFVLIASHKATQQCVITDISFEVLFFFFSHIHRHHTMGPKKKNQNHKTEKKWKNPLNNKIHFCPFTWSSFRIVYGVVMRHTERNNNNHNIILQTNQIISKSSESSSHWRFGALKLIYILILIFSCSHIQHNHFSWPNCRPQNPPSH